MAGAHEASSSYLPLPHHHVAQPQRVIEALQLLVLPVPLHQTLRHLAVLALVFICHLQPEGSREHQRKRGRESERGERCRRQGTGQRSKLRVNLNKNKKTLREQREGYAAQEVNA